MRYVFLHELAHVKRGDIWTSWVVNLLTAAHWFNPLIWGARRRVVIDREAACDAHVLAALDRSDQRDYGRTLLALMQQFNTAQWAPGIAGISESNSNLKRRILMIKHFRSPTRLTAWSGVGLCLLIGLATLTNAQEKKVGPTDIQCAPADIYGYTATNGGTMIAAQLTNTGPVAITVDVEFWVGAPDEGTKIGRGGLEIEAGMTGTEAIPWLVKNGSHSVTVRIDPDNSVVETDEANNTIVTSIRYEDGRFSQNRQAAYLDRMVGVGPVRGNSDSGQSGTGPQLDAMTEELKAQLTLIDDLESGKLPIPRSSTLGWIEEKALADPLVMGWQQEVDDLIAQIREVEAIDSDATVLEDIRAQRDALRMVVDGQLAKVRGRELEALRAKLLGEHELSQNRRRGRGLVGETTPTRGASKLYESAKVRAECQNRLKKLGLVFKMYANESKGQLWPVLSQEPGRLMFEWGGNSGIVNGLSVLSTEFAGEGAYLTACPSLGGEGDLPDDQAFTYLGYVLRDDADVRDYAAGYRKSVTAASDDAPLFLEDLSSSRKGENPIFRIREGIERFLITDINNPAAAATAQSQIPVVIEWPENHTMSGGRQGGSVLYMDGHVEFVKYPGKWPMTEETIGILRGLAGRDPIAVPQSDE
jgi:hypothetical protein